MRELLPSDVRFEWGIKGEPQNNGRFSLYALKVSTPDGKAPLDGSVIVDARETYAERGAEAKVSMSMNSEGIQDWARLTGDNIGRCIAIVLDGYVYSAPVVRQKIEGGSSEISGNFTIQEAKDLANVLKSGKVPAPARIIQDTVVGQVKDMLLKLKQDNTSMIGIFHDLEFMDGLCDRVFNISEGTFA